MKMMAAPSVSASRLNSPFLYCPLKLSSSFRFSRKTLKIQRSPASYPCVRAADLDQNTIVAITVGVVSVAVGIGIPVFYETQIDNASKRDNTQPCFPCNGSGARKYLLFYSVYANCVLYLAALYKSIFLVPVAVFTDIMRQLTVELGGDEKEVSQCINCDGVGSLTCTTCQGSGIQPRYLDRREFKDDD
ncbi:protein SPA, chloroplastic [Sesamum angolense]|uniref:Protein SPA, chloroplastic n=1 Tax=Sesamum angolense TaxID=2727404 RepID=A0AAE1WCC8_9LAMI|nr:protein SPA, chloroplastic [Sesamum angolense]